jgi:hypothetical protein
MTPGVRLITAALLASTGYAGDAPGTAAFDAVLKRYVLEDGTVRYAALKADIEPLDRFVQQIGAASPDSQAALFPSREHRLAYWLNTYNALVIWAMAKEYPQKKDRLSSVFGQGQFFYLKKFKVGGVSRSLDDIETNAIRKRFKDPRIHFAIVCASKGCPWLAREAFTAARLESQLEGGARLFLNQERNVRVDTAKREVGLSKIFEWYKDDFGSSREAVLGFIARYRPDGAQLRQGGWKLRYFDYDWGINDARR